MYALIGRVRIKPGHEEDTAAMAREHGPELVRSMTGSKSAYWARPVDEESGPLQHSFWLFETEADARSAESTFNSLRAMPDAPAELVGAQVCEVIATM